MLGDLKRTSSEKLKLEFQNKTIKELKKEELAIRRNRTTIAKKRSVIINKLKVIQYNYEKAGIKQNIMRIELGRKKGTGCPALQSNPNQYNNISWKCAIKKYIYYPYTDEDIFRKGCYKCRFKRDTIERKLLFGKVFE